MKTFLTNVAKIKISHSVFSLNIIKDKLTFHYWNLFCCRFPPLINRGRKRGWSDGRCLTPFWWYLSKLDIYDEWSISAFISIRKKIAKWADLIRIDDLVNLSFVKVLRHYFCNCITNWAHFWNRMWFEINMIYICLQVTKILSNHPSNV